MNGTLNKVMLIGHLGDEVKMHYFDGGNAIGRFPLATNEVYTNKEGVQIKNTDWHNIVVRNKLAEICEKYLTKGDKIYCEGKIKTRQWTDDNNQTKYMTEIQVHELTFLSNKKAEHKQNIDQQTTKKTSSKPDTTTKDDLPF